MEKLISILIAEDEPELLQILEEAFKQSKKFFCVTAADGAEAFAKGRNQPFDVFLFDHQMPKMSGAKLLQSLRALKGNTKTPTIFLTAYPEQVFEECKKLKIEEDVLYLSKPFDQHLLVERATGLAEEYRKTRDPNYRPSFRVNVDFINPFLASVVQMTKTKGKVQKVSPGSTHVLKAGQGIKADVTGTLAISAPQFNGKLAISYSEGTFVKLASNLLSKTFPNLESVAQEATGSIMNTVFEETKLSLNRIGYQFNKTGPTITRTPNHEMKCGPNELVLVTPFESDLGNFQISIWLPK